MYLFWSFFLYKFCEVTVLKKMSKYRGYWALASKLYFNVSLSTYFWRQSVLRTPLTLEWVAFSEWFDSTSAPQHDTDMNASSWSRASSTWCNSRERKRTRLWPGKETRWRGDGGTRKGEIGEERCWRVRRKMHPARLSVTATLYCIFSLHKQGELFLCNKPKVILLTAFPLHGHC